MLEDLAPGEVTVIATRPWQTEEQYAQATLTLVSGAHNTVELRF